MSSRNIMVAVALVLALAGCADDGSGDGGSPDRSPSPTASSDATDLASSDVTDDSSVAPATGPVMSNEVLSFHLPAGPEWMISGSSAGVTEFTPDGAVDDYVRLALATPARDLAQVEEIIPRSRKERWPETRQVENRIVNGVEGIVLVAESDELYLYEFATSYQGMLAAIRFEFTHPDATRMAWIDSMLASVEWK